ncbi:MAG: hypothetical protein JOY99_17255 [Sphingomonadaceae bacterium]|nr:hypothetical protein [Sphingomonadaceae bacterium]
MTDRPQFDPAAIDDGAELVFEEVEIAPPMPKRVKTGRKAAAADAPLAEDPAPAIAPETVAPPIAEEPAPAPATVVPAAAAAPAAGIATFRLGLPTWLLAGALALALFTSVIATVGLLVASRTIAAADAARHSAEAEARSLAEAPATLDKLDHVIAGEQAALAALAQSRAGQPVTLTALQKELDGLRTAIAAQQPRQDAEIIAVTKSGQSELADRLAAVQDTLDHMDAKAPKP